MCNGSWAGVVGRLDIGGPMLWPNLPIIGSGQKDRRLKAGGPYFLKEAPIGMAPMILRGRLFIGTYERRL